MRLLILGFPVLIAFVLGCNPKDGSAPTDGGNGPGEPKASERADPAPPGPAAATDEDPEVVGYLKARGWNLGTDYRIADGKWLTYLTVQSRDKPFEDITITPDDYKMLARSRTVQVLDLRRVKNTDDGLKTVAAIPQLEGILVGGEDVTDAGVKALAGCKSLDSVALLGSKKVTDAGVKELAALPKLQSLYLLSLTLDGSAFVAFAGSKTLRTVNLEYIDGFTDAGARNLAKLPNLDDLKIGTGFGEKKLTSAGIKAIVDARLPAKFEFDKKLIDDALFESLVAKGWLYGPTPPGSREKKPATPEEVRFIALDDSQVTDKGFAAVLNCTNVTSLHLKRTGITDETLKKLTAFKTLDYLSLEKTKVTAAGLEAVSGLPIKHLALEGCEMSEGSFRAMGKMTNLQELWLSDAKMKAAWLEYVATLPKLKDLNLMRADFDDAAVKWVATMPSLEDLTLNDTNLGDAGFKELLKLPRLKKLFVDGTKVTKDVYLQAKKDYPKRFLYFYRYDSK